MKPTEIITNGSAVMGMEFGSTRVKAVLTGPDNAPLASGGCGWENSQNDGIWTYPLDQVRKKAAECFASLQDDVRRRYNTELTALASAGFSGMMHGYLVFDADDRLLVPFRTWRNNITAQASQELTELLRYPVPQRWSIAHLYQAVLNGEDHVEKISYMTTLSGYVHWQLTGRKVLGICDASGMFPVDLKRCAFDQKRITLCESKIPQIRLSEILPEVIPAGSMAGSLSEEGAKFLDPSGTLKPGIPLCPPEGDAGTGMAATNSVRVRTGNVSAGTSVFAMLVMDKEPSSVHEEIDLVATPDGKLAGMAHSNNCTSDYDAWIGLFGQAAKALGANVPTPRLYDTLLELALEGDADCGNMLSYGYVSGEHMTGFSEGRPLFVRHPEQPLKLNNFIRAHLFTALCALRTGLDVLTKKEGVRVDELRGHGGFFKTPHVGQKIMAAATGIPVSLLNTAGEGGAWGMALLAAFMNSPQTDLADFLDETLAEGIGEAVKPDPKDTEGFNAFFRRYHKGLAIESAAVENLT